MQVVALKPGFYEGARRRTGDIFQMNVKGDKLPSWVKAAPDPHKARQEAAAAKQAEVDKQIEGARVASGGKAAKRKTDAIGEQLAG